MIAGAELAGRRTDVLIQDGRVAALGVLAKARAPVIHADGGALLPGLHDHHAHLLAYAAARTSVKLSPSVPVSDALQEADSSLAPGDWLRITGFHESFAGDLDRERLDAMVPGRPVRVQHRSGAMWVLNTCALELTGVSALNDPGVERDAQGVPNGRIHRLDDWLGRQLRGQPPDLDAAAADLNALGVTGLTDATPFATVDDLGPLVQAAAGGLSLRLVVMGAPGLLLDDYQGVDRGPCKIVISDHALPGLDELVATFRVARLQRRAVAVHSLTLESLLLALAAWDEVGSWPGDRLEHGAVVPTHQACRLAGHRIVVVTQPHFILERGDDYLREVERADRDDLYPIARLLAAGVEVAFGTDAPFGGPDPWRAIEAAVTRRTPSGATIGRAERVSARFALGRFLTAPLDPGGRPRVVRVGMPADLCLLQVPLAEALRQPSADLVRTTFVAGRTVFSC